MPDQTTHPLKFNCYKCKKESIYRNYLKEGKKPEGNISVIKRCTTCGIENKVELPEGWIADRTGSVLRGLKND